MEFIKKTIAFFKKHPIIRNLLYICILGWVILICALFFLDSWTRHGETAIVPSVKGLNLSAAEAALSAKGMVCQLSDSIYDRSYPPGTVVEQSPRPNTKVKPGRTVYLTIVAFTPKLITVPHFYNVSLREGRAMFEGLGIREVRIVEVESEYKDLVLGAKMNGVPLKPGQRIPVTASVTLEVGKGRAVEETDSIDTDSDNITDIIKDYFNGK